MENTWETIALPALRWVAQHEGPGAIRVREIAQDIGADPSALGRELERLIGDGLLSGQLSKGLGEPPGDWGLYPLALTGSGAKAVGMWPSGDAGDVLLEVLRRAEAAESDPDRKGRLHRAVEAIGGLAHDFVVELGVSIAKSAAGLPPGV